MSDFSILIIETVSVKNEDGFLKNGILGLVLEAEILKAKTVLVMQTRAVFDVYQSKRMGSDGT